MDKNIVIQFIISDYFISLNISAEEESKRLQTSPVLVQ